MSSAMRFLRRSALLRLFVLPFTLTLLLGACQKWVPLEPPVSRALAEEHPNPVRLTLTESEERVEFHAWRVEADSIVGVTMNGQNASVPMKDVEAVEAQETSAGKSALMAGGLVVGLAAIGAALVAIYCCDF